MRTSVRPMTPSHSRTDWLLVGLIFCLGLFAAAQFGKISLSLDALAQAYDRSLPQLATLVSLVGGIGIVFGVVAGGIVARLGGKKVLLAAVIFGAILSGLEGLVPPFAAMIPLRIAEGLSHLAIVVACPALMAAAANDHDRPVAMSLWAMFFGVAFSVVSLIAPATLALGGLPLLYGGHAVGLLCVGLLVWMRLPDVAPDPKPPLRYLRAHVRSYSNPRIAAPGLGFLMYTLMYLAIMTFLPTAIGRPDLAAVLPLISLAGTFAAGLLARRYRPDLIAASGFVVTLFGAAVATTGAIWPLYLMFIGLGLTPGGCFAAIPYFNSDMGDRARAAGVIAQLGNVGTTLGTPLFAVGLSIAGTTGLLGLMILASCAGLGLIALMAWQITHADHAEIDP